MGGDSWRMSRRTVYSRVYTIIINEQVPRKVMRSVILIIISLTVLSMGVFSPFLPSAMAQEVITVNQTTPCFLNYTASVDMWENCGFKDDFLSAALLPWEWITGGFFSMVIVSIFVLFSYIKYHKIVYPIMIGTAFLPISFTFFPEVFLSFAFLMTFIGIGIMIWYIYIRQTKEY